MFNGDWKILTRDTALFRSRGRDSSPPPLLILFAHCSSLETASPVYERACVRSHRAADNWLRVFRSVAMFIRAARSYHYFIISKKVIVHGGMAHEVKLRAEARVKNELETRFVIISLMSSGYLSSDAYCPIVIVLYIVCVYIYSHNLSPCSRFRARETFHTSTEQFVVRRLKTTVPPPFFFLPRTQRHCLLVRFDRQFVEISPNNAESFVFDALLSLSLSFSFFHSFYEPFDTSIESLFYWNPGRNG